jgi:hypothetical protein
VIVPLPMGQLVTKDARPVEAGVAAGVARHEQDRPAAPAPDDRAARMVSGSNDPSPSTLSFAFAPSRASAIGRLRRRRRSPDETQAQEQARVNRSSRAEVAPSHSSGRTVHTGIRAPQVRPSLTARHGRFSGCAGSPAAQRGVVRSVRTTKG